MILIKKMKLFTLGIDFNPIDWIISGEVKIRVVIQFHYFPPIPPRIPPQTLKSPPSHITYSISIDGQSLQTDTQDHL